MNHVVQVLVARPHTWLCTSKASPLLSEKIRLMMLFRMVPRKVLMPNTKAQSSLVSDDAIWKLHIQSPPHHQTRRGWPWATWYANMTAAHSHGNGHQELVEAPEEYVGHVTDPDVVSGAHEQQQASLHCCDHTNDKLWPDIPADLNIPCDEGGQGTWKEAKDFSQSGDFFFLMVRERPQWGKDSTHIVPIYYLDWYHWVYSWFAIHKCVLSAMH